MRLDEDTAEFVTEDLAARIPYGPYRGRIDAVVDAIAAERRPATIAKASRTAAAAVWGDGLRAAVEAELESLEAEAREALARIEAARGELTRPVADNRLAAALVAELTLCILDDVAEFGITMELLDEQLHEAGPEDRRSIALRAAAELAPADVPVEERNGAAAGLVAPNVDPRSPQFAQAIVRALARTLATDARRRELRTTLADACDGVRGEVPALAAAVDELLGEPMPDDPANDDLWVAALWGPTALDAVR